METQRQIYEKLREMEAEENARRAQRQLVHREEKHNRAYYFSIAPHVCVSSAPGCGR
jgi:Mn-containing catalase